MIGNSSKVGGFNYLILAKILILAVIENIAISVSSVNRNVKKSNWFVIVLVIGSSL